MADGRIVIGEAVDLNPQYAALKNYYQQLVVSGVLGTNERLTVTGHSLGGFLAQAFTIDFPTNVTRTYTFNSQLAGVWWSFDGHSGPARDC